MYIDHIQNLRAFETNVRNSRQNKKPVAAVRDTKDTYEPAKEPEMDRDKLLSSIRKKIKSGFYNSEKVIDELGDSFAKVFDKSL